MVVGNGHRPVNIDWFLVIRRAFYILQNCYYKANIPIMKKISLFLILISTLTACTHKAPNEEGPIKIGFIGPLSGNAAIYGEVVLTPLEIAFDEINAAGGINGRKLKIIAEDGKCAVKEGTIAAQKLINIDKVKIIIPLCTGEVLATAPIAERNKVILFASWASAPSISDAGDYIFRNGISDTVTAELFSKTVIKNHQKIGIITEQSTYPIGVRDSFKKEFEALGGELVEVEFAQNANEAKTQITKLISKTPQAIFVNADTPATILMPLKHMKELGFKGQIYSNVVIGGEETIASPLADGTIFFTDPIIPENEAKKEIFRKFKEKTGHPPAFDFPIASTYDVAYILKEALEAVGEDPTAIKEYIYDMKEFSGALGTYHFDENGDTVGIKIMIKEIKNGKAIPY